ncbi:MULTISPECIES: cache domain-containing protein [unclassified Oceanispirochaeta]|uniref:cache domain-containing protein n=1 Tax=unclassified Oceanispirochaeta TaxID=2635722 RepID=UPI0011C03FE2|nr:MULTISPECIES: cache domain-containing protein [unclassified Oceanispirochaeta]MBF9016374.1 cache domain-containing protein [Oceanispirochaeta sp. M2]NPD72836.1 cache domain-containing protein [Oceanispirochaeta sp. M1]
MDKKIAQVMVIHIAVVSILIYGFLYLHHNSSKLCRESWMLRDRANRINLALEAYLEPILRGAEVAASQDFLIDWLKNEGDRTTLDKYLSTQIELIGCEAIDLASVESEIVYQSAGTTVRMEKGNERDLWFYDFMESETDRSNEFFYDSLEGILYLYHNIKLYETSHQIVGVMGILIRYDQVSELLSLFSDEGIEAYFTDKSGEIIIHSDQRQIGNVAIYDYYGLLQRAKELGGSTEMIESGSNDGDSSIFYFESLNSYLVVEQNISSLRRWFQGTYALLPIIILSLIVVNAFLYLALRKFSGRHKEESAE